MDVRRRGFVSRRDGAATVVRLVEEVMIVKMGFCWWSEVIEVIGK